MTGGTGLVGSAVCAALAAAGADPVCYDLAPVPEQLGPLAGQVPVERGDALDLPAAVSPNPWQGIRVNYLGTVNVLEAARMEGMRRVVFCSSNTVYAAATVTDRPVRESDPTVPRTVYATTKLASEHTGVNYAEQYGCTCWGSTVCTTRWGTSSPAASRWPAASRNARRPPDSQADKPVPRGPVTRKIIVRRSPSR